MGGAGRWLREFSPFRGVVPEVCPQAAMQLEIITGRPPTVLRYLEPDFWKVFPHTPAWNSRASWRWRRAGGRYWDRW